MTGIEIGPAWRINATYLNPTERAAIYRGISATFGLTGPDIERALAGITSQPTTRKATP